MYVLWCIFYKAEIKNVNLHTELRALKTAKFVSESGTITDLGKVIVSEMDVPKRGVEVTTSMVDKYLALFPKIKLPSGKYARSDKNNIIKNFEWFFKTFDYSWEEVLKATANYVDEYERKGFLYMMTSQYFISKVGSDRLRTSELANQCNMLRTGEDSYGQDTFHENVV